MISSMSEWLKLVSLQFILTKIFLKLSLAKRNYLCQWKAMKVVTSSRTWMVLGRGTEGKIDRYGGEYDRVHENGLLINAERKTQIPVGANGTSYRTKTRYGETPQ